MHHLCPHLGSFGANYRDVQNTGQVDACALPDSELHEVQNHTSLTKIIGEQEGVELLCPFAYSISQESLAPPLPPLGGLVSQNRGVENHITFCS